VPYGAAGRMLALRPALAPVRSNRRSEQRRADMMHETGTPAMFGVLELPFLFIAVYFAFQVAGKLRGGTFGLGMIYLAWGFVVMAIGHLHMQIDRYFGVNLFGTIFGPALGDAVWIIALAVTWALSAYGFVLLYRSAKGA
jgi:hypothetical protein